MARLDIPAPVRMQRVALAVRSDRLRAALVDLGRLGAVELSGELPPAEGAASDALRRLGGLPSGDGLEPVVAVEEPDLEDLEARGARDLLAGEQELDRRRGLAVTQDGVSLLVGWTPSTDVRALHESMAPDGIAVVELPPPPEQPPTLLRQTRLTGPFRMLVDTYGVLPYSSVDPTAFAALAFVVMFGMMFGDVGHGGLLVLMGLWLSRTRGGPLAPYRRIWPLLVAAGTAGVAFGFLYGELFGPTHLIRTLWLEPLREAPKLLEAAVVMGSALLSVSYLFGFANRWREGGGAAAVFGEGGLAGALIFAGIGIAALAWTRDISGGATVGFVVALFGLALQFAGALVRAGGGFAGALRAIVEAGDAVIRIASNIVSFTRLAAFGLMHAALGLVTLEAAQNLGGHGAAGWLGAASVFVVGTLIALALEGVVAGVQALRLEYYELFSRLFEEEGRPFTPFTINARELEGTS
jgi:V/A-type H+-transporting ATPase subunit I